VVRVTLTPVDRKKIRRTAFLADRFSGGEKFAPAPAPQAEGGMFISSDVDCSEASLSFARTAIS